MPTLPPQIDSPELTDEERAGLMIAHECFVLAGEAEWVIDEEQS
jgi:hypothetical protein